MRSTWPRDEPGIVNVAWQAFGRKAAGYFRRSLAAGTRAIGVLLLTSLAPGAWAQKPPADLTEMKLEELMNIEVASVYGASKYLQKVTEAPSSVTIVTSDEIQKYGYRTLADALRSVRGFYVSYDRNYSYLGLRGFARPGDYNTRILLLVDGHRVNENVYDMAPIGTEFPIDVDLIDRVEIIRGPSSSIYGTNAFFGVINIITKRGRDLKGAEVSGDLASFGSRRGRASYGNKFKNGLEMLFSGSLYDSHGHGRLHFAEFDSLATYNGIAENGDQDQFEQFFAKLSYRDFTLQGVYGAREKRVPTASWGAVFNDPRNHTLDVRAYLDITYARRFANQWELLGRLYCDKYYYDGDFVFDYSESDTPFLVVNKDFGRGRWWGGELKMAKTLFERHKFALGSEYRHNLQQDMFNYDADPFFQYLDARGSSKVWSLYLQDEIALRNDLMLNAGVRHDRYATFGGTTNPRLGLIYSPFEKTTLKLLYGDAFRAPNAYELSYYGTGLKPNPNLKPETIETYEVVWEQYIGKRFRVAAAGFHYNIGGLINQQTDPADGLSVYKNAERINAEGLELELEKKWAWGLEGGLTYAFQDAKSQTLGGHLTNSPKHLGRFNLSVPLVKKKLFASMDVRYVGQRKTLAGNYAGAHVVPNFTLFSRNLMRRWEISASLYNLFNKRYGDPGAEEHCQDIIEQDGRSFRVKIGYRF